MKKLLVWLLLWMPCVWAQPNSGNFIKVQAELAKVTNVSGNFQQIRNMALLSKPLVSMGDFQLSRKEGLKWYQAKPFSSTLIVTQNKIEQRIGNNPPNIITKEQQPIVFSFSNVFLSVFNGNTKAIEEYFKINFMGDINKWSMVLTPKVAPLNKAIVNIKLTGDKYIRTIKINEAKHNSMTIYLSNIKAEQSNN